MSCICIHVNVFIVTITINWRPQVAADSGSLYLTIADAIAADLSTGRLTPGDRLPPQRELADRLGVALGTVHPRLHRGRATRARARSWQARHDHQRRWARAIRSELTGRHGWADRPVGQPPRGVDQSRPRVGTQEPGAPQRPRAPSRIPVPGGLPQHREAAALWLGTQGVKCTPDSVVMTSGAQHAILITLAAIARPGDEIACEPYTYPGVKVAAELLGLRVTPAPADDAGLDPDGLEHLCRTRPIRALYVIPTMQNPTSVILSAARKKAIAAVARRHDVLVVEDEIHRALVERPIEPFVSLAPERSFLVTSTSAATSGLSQERVSMRRPRVRGRVRQCRQPSVRSLARSSAGAPGTPYRSMRRAPRRVGQSRDSDPAADC